MKSKTQDKKRLNAVGMRICALFAVLAVVFAAFMTTVPHALASETGNPASVKGRHIKSAPTPRSHRSNTVRTAR